ncbi:hypothetical protein LJR251_005898 [Rhizobium rhizogenes]|uniref:hypothetical protein n=1 Tax=Rhizobium rhizogenes TaxID=359 RepID=UPI003ECE75C3
MAKMTDTVDASAIEAAEAEYLAARAANLLSLSGNSHGAGEEPTEELAQRVADELLRFQLCPAWHRFHACGGRAPFHHHLAICARSSCSTG